MTHDVLKTHVGFLYTHTYIRVVHALQDLTYHSTWTCIRACALLSSELIVGSLAFESAFPFLFHELFIMQH